MKAIGNSVRDASSTTYYGQYGIRNSLNFISESLASKKTQENTPADSFNHRVPANFRRRGVRFPAVSKKQGKGKLKCQNGRVGVVQKPDGGGYHEQENVDDGRLSQC